MIFFFELVEKWYYSYCNGFIFRLLYSWVCKIVMLRRSPSLHSWTKINTDGSYSLSNHATCGGVLRNHEDNFLVDFSIIWGTTLFFNAEHWGSLHGVKIALATGVSKNFMLNQIQNWLPGYLLKDALNPILVLLWL